MYFSSIVTNKRSYYLLFIYNYLRRYANESVIRFPDYYLRQISSDLCHSVADTYTCSNCFTYCIVFFYILGNQFFYVYTIIKTSGFQSRLIIMACNWYLVFTPITVMDYFLQQLIIVLHRTQKKLMLDSFSLYHLINLSWCHRNYGC